MAYRKKIEDLITSNGGEYRGNLTKDVTHLIARVPSGSKYTYAGEWGIKIVSDEWLMQSLERGMILDEKLFNLLLPETERGQNAWIRKSVSVSSLGKRAREEDSVPKSSRKLRRTASAKLSSQNIGLWTDIVRGGTGVGENKVDEWDDQQKDQGLNGDMLKAGKSERDVTEMLNMNENSKPQFRRQNTLDQNNEFSLARAGRTEGIFKGQRFFMHGFNERQVCILESVAGLTGFKFLYRAPFCRSICVLMRQKSCKAFTKFPLQFKDTDTYLYLITSPTMTFRLDLKERQCQS